MNNLMEELMAEMNRVNNLEAEVDTAVNQLKNETGLARSEKYNEIVKFLGRMISLLLKAKAIRKEYVTSTYLSNVAIVNTGIRYQKDSSSPAFPMRLKITGESVHIVDNPPDREVGTLIWRGQPYGMDDRTKFLVDQWGEANYDAVENQIERLIKESIAKRIEVATQKLKTANEEHAKYYGVEEEE